MQKSIIILVIILLKVSTSNLYAQEIEWNRISFGVNFSYFIPEKKINNFWENTIEVGGDLEYKLSKHLYIGAGILFSYFESKEVESFPNFYHLSIPVELKVLFPILSQIQLLASSGIQNNTFMFIGDAAESLNDNNTESEFGVFMTLGVRATFWDIKGIEIYTKFQTVFTSPESTEYINIGARFFF